MEKRNPRLKGVTNIKTADLDYYCDTIIAGVEDSYCRNFVVINENDLNNFQRFNDDLFKNLLKYIGFLVIDTSQPSEMFKQGISQYAFMAIIDKLHNAING